MRPRGRSNYNRPQRDMTLINERIRFPQVRVIDEQNNQLGVMQTRDALEAARERGFDLILVAPQAQPPVCRIMDYGKYKYEKSKRDKVAHSKGKSAASEMKAVRLHPPTGDHDRAILIRHAERFLRGGHKVRVVCQFRRRENAYPELGRQQLDKVAEALAEICTVEGQIIKQGRDMTMMLTPKPGVKPLPKVSKDDAKTQAEEAEFEALQQRIAAEAEPEDAVAEDAVAEDAVAEDAVAEDAAIEGGEADFTAENTEGTEEDTIKG